ncbi:MAG: ABC transporter permease [Xanthobacteraceae bacterium]
MTSSAEVAHQTRSADRDQAGLSRDPTLATLWSRLASYQTLLLAAVLIVVLAALVLPPFVFLLKASVVDAQRGGEWSLVNFESVLGSRRFLITSANSLVFAAGSAVVALAIGWTTAWIVERTNTPLRPLAYLTAIISLGTPYILYVTAWLLLFGKAGPVNQLYRSLTGTSDVLINVYSMPGMIMVEGFLWSPLAFLLVGATLRNANPELEEAARVSGAGTWMTIRRVTLRLSLPSILALAMLVFIRAIEAFEVPALVGLPGRISVLTTDIYGSMVAQAPPDIGGASALSVVMLALVLVLLAVYGRLSRHAERFATITGKGFRPRPFDLGRLRYAAAGILVLNFLLLLLVPIAMLAWVSLLPFYQPLSMAALARVTLDNYRTVFSPDHVGLIANTLLVAVATATLAVALTFLAAWLAVRRGPGAWVVERLATIPLVFPGLILGIAVMQLFLHLPIPLYGTLGILIWAFVINYLPYGMRYSAAGMLQIHRELEESAEMCGASAFMRLRRIVAPLLAPALLAGWLFIFLMAARVLSLAILLSGPSSQTMAVTLFDLWTNGQGTELAALGLIWSMLMAMIAAVFYLLARRSAASALARA